MRADERLREAERRLGRGLRDDEVGAVIRAGEAGFEAAMELLLEQGEPASDADLESARYEPATDRYRDRRQRERKVPSVRRIPGPGEEGFE